MSSASTALTTAPSKLLGPLLSNSTKPATPVTEIPPSPGTFRHPRLTEIIKRQSASSLSGQKIQNATINIVAIALSYVFQSGMNEIIQRCLTITSIPSSAVEPSTLILFLRLLFLANTFICLRPVIPYVSKKDDVVDIPLTPSQRALLGLSPSTQNSPMSAAGGTGFVTPPRYRRDGGMNTATSIQNSPTASSTGRRSTPAASSTSPLSARRLSLGFSPFSRPNDTQSARTNRRTSDTGFAGLVGGSPLFHRAIGNDLNQSTYTTVGGRAGLVTSTSSFGLGLSRSQSFRERRSGLDDTDSTPGTPSPGGSKRQPGVNYKWLYDKGARLPRSESIGF